MEGSAGKGALLLLGQPVHQELRHRHRGRDQKITGRQLVLDLLLAFDRLLLSGKALPFVAALAVLVLIGVADTVRAAAFRDICHRFASLSSCPVEPRIEAVFRDADASACPQDTELGGAVAQVVGDTLADDQHLRDLLSFSAAVLVKATLYFRSWSFIRATLGI